jgi:hypothetical protein
MSAAMGVALVCTVVLLATSAYFVMASIPLLILKHDTPLDARFVRGYFNVCYRIAAASAAVTAISYALAGRLAFAAGAATLALLALGLRRKVLPTLDALGARIQTGGSRAIAGFRRAHLTAIAINAGQLAAIVWAVIGLRL